MLGGRIGSYASIQFDFLLLRPLMSIHNFYVEVGKLVLASVSV